MEFSTETHKNYAIFISCLVTAQEYWAYCENDIVNYYVEKFKETLPTPKNPNQKERNFKAIQKYKLEVSGRVNKLSKIIDNLTNEVEKTKSGNKMITEILDEFCNFAKHIKENINIID